MKLTDHTHACKNIAQKICRNLEKLVKSLIFGGFLAFQNHCATADKGQAKQHALIFVRGQQQQLRDLLPSKDHVPNQVSTQPLLKDSQHTFEGKLLIFWIKILDIFSVRLLKLRHYKKATKFEKISHLFSQNSLASKQVGDFCGLFRKAGLYLYFMRNFSCFDSLFPFKFFLKW